MIGKSFEAKFKWPGKKGKIVNFLNDKQARLDPRAKSRIPKQSFMLVSKYFAKAVLWAETREPKMCYRQLFK